MYLGTAYFRVLFCNLSAKKLIAKSISQNNEIISNRLKCSKIIITSRDP